MANLKELGIALKAYRLASGEAIKDLAAAIEVSDNTVREFEAGIKAPDIEIIELFIRHYSLRDQESERLLALAGLESDSIAIDQDFEIDDIDISSMNKQLDVVIGPVFYADDIEIVTSDNGVTINFLQSTFGSSDNRIIISRIGMSHNLAKKFSDQLKNKLNSKN